MELDYPKLQKAARNVIRTREHGYAIDAEDLAQEAALRILRGRNSYSGPMLDECERSPLIGDTRFERINIVYADSLDEGWGNCICTADTLRYFWLRDMLDSLDQRTQFIVYAIYWRGERMREIAEQLALSQPRVSQIHAEGIRQLRKALR